jgi:starch-binding outer membrane protein, SusD/RagB family
MRRDLEAGLLAVGLALGVSACDDFLTGSELVDNPNNPTQASNINLLVAGQANLNVLMEGHLARASCIWTQQCAGLIQQYFGLGVYEIGEDEFFETWAQIYGGGGLIDLRRIQASTRESGDSVFAGIAMVMEAWLVGTAADAWGDVPYSQATDSAVVEPALDPQQDVYAAIQAKLDTAITFLSATDPISNVGPGSADLVYAGDATKWRALAYTLKARFHLHTAEVLGEAAYQAAFAAAQSGIQSPADDYLAYHSSEVPERNVWQQFTDVWSGYLGAGAFMVNLLQASDDPRLAEYYAPTEDGEFLGAEPGELEAAVSSLSDERLASDFRQPLVTWAESQLILAESAHRLGDEGVAATTLNSVRADADLPPVSASGAALLEAILTEKYIRTFQSIEAWNDYRRTCFPALTPAPGAADLPPRVQYPRSEANANPNIPATDPLRNWNDPASCA